MMLTEPRISDRGHARLFSLMTGIPGASREVQPSSALMRAIRVPMERRETSDEGDTNRFPHETDSSATGMPDSKPLEVFKRSLLWLGSCHRWRSSGSAQEIKNKRVLTIRTTDFRSISRFTHGPLSSKSSYCVFTIRSQVKLLLNSSLISLSNVHRLLTLWRPNWSLPRILLSILPCSRGIWRICQICRCFFDRLSLSSPLFSSLTKMKTN